MGMCTNTIRTDFIVRRMYAHDIMHIDVLLYPACMSLTPTRATIHSSCVAMLHAGDTSV